MHHDVVIVGGGLVGCLTALELADHGIDCAIVERHRLLAGASALNAGGIYLQIQHQAGSLGPLQQAQMAHLIPLIKATKPAWLRLGERLSPLLKKAARQATCGPRYSGGLVVATNKQEVEDLQRKFQLEHEWGLSVTYLEGVELRALDRSIAPSIVAACFCQDEGFWDPGSLASLVEAQVRAAGVKVYEDHAIVGVTRHSRHFAVTTTKSAVQGARMVCALGAYTAPFLDMLAVPCSLRALPIQVSVSAPTELKIPYFTRYAGDRVSVKQMADTRIFIGGGWEADWAPSLNSGARANQESAAHNRRVAERIYPEIRALDLREHRAGLAAWSMDGLPVLGHAYAAPSSGPELVVACGGNGFSLAPVYAEVLSRLIRGEEVALPLAPFSVRRFAAARETSAGTFVPSQQSTEAYLPPD